MRGLGGGALEDHSLARQRIEGGRETATLFDVAHAVRAQRIDGDEQQVCAGEPRQGDVQRSLCGRVPECEASASQGDRVGRAARPRARERSEGQYTVAHEGSVGTEQFRVHVGPGVEPPPGDGNQHQGGHGEHRGRQGRASRRREYNKERRGEHERREHPEAHVQVLVEARQHAVIEAVQAEGSEA